MMRYATPLLLAGLAALALSACGSDDVTRKFGTSREGQEEVRASALPPLSVPPVLAQRPPRAGARPPDDAAIAGSAGTPSVGAPPVTPGQDALIEAAGPSAPANIRERVDRDAQIERQDPGFTDALLFGPPETRQSAGGEPIVQHGSKSWLGSIF